jgi:hypothetical protein
MGLNARIDALLLLKIRCRQFGQQFLAAANSQVDAEISDSDVLRSTG